MNTILVFVFLSFCVDITLIIYLKGLKSLNSLFGPDSKVAVSELVTDGKG